MVVDHGVRGRQGCLGLGYNEDDETDLSANKVGEAGGEAGGEAVVHDAGAGAPRWCRSRGQRPPRRGRPPGPTPGQAHADAEWCGS